MLHSYLACMHTFFSFSNLHLTNLMCRGLDFVELVLVNFSGPNLPFLLDMENDTQRQGGKIMRR